MKLGEFVTKLSVRPMNCVLALMDKQGWTFKDDVALLDENRRWLTYRVRGCGKKSYAEIESALDSGPRRVVRRFNQWQRVLRHQ